LALRSQRSRRLDFDGRFILPSGNSSANATQKGHTVDSGKKKRDHKDRAAEAKGTKQSNRKSVSSWLAVPYYCRGRAKMEGIVG
jgi:hypothetical protein